MSPTDRSGTVDRPPGSTDADGSSRCTEIDRPVRCTDADRFVPDDRSSPGLVALPDRRDDPEEITVAPRSVTEDRQTTAWITAATEDVVDLSAMR